MLVVMSLKMRVMMTVVALMVITMVLMPCFCVSTAATIRFRTLSII